MCTKKKNTHQQERLEPQQRLESLQLDPLQYSELYSFLLLLLHRLQYSHPDDNDGDDDNDDDEDSDDNGDANDHGANDLLLTMKMMMAMMMMPMMRMLRMMAMSKVSCTIA